jgi:hypothetical protein
MPIYQVMIEGKNFLIQFEGDTSKYGFFTYRWVDSEDAVSAEYAAVELVRKTEDLRAIVLNSPDDRPTMDVCEVIEVKSIERSTGFMWYKENDQGQ